MKTPICSNCGAKFAHDAATASCKKCGIPDEIVSLGRGGIQIWNKDRLKNEGVPKRERKQEKRGGSYFRRRNKHGRMGVKRARIKTKRSE